MPDLLDLSLNTEVGIINDVERTRIYKTVVSIKTVWINTENKPIDGVDLRIGRDCEEETILSFRGMESLFASG
jgi:hypothetical protein